MTRPVRVTVVRYQRDTAEKVAIVILATGFLFLIAWLLMLIVGTITPWHPSYWHALLAVIGIRLLPRGGSGWLSWTWPAKKGEFR